MSQEADIVIIGAGAAGLAAARALAAEPAKVLVLEARDRIGGRAQTIRAGGWPADLGCGWLHSADVNPLARLAQPLGFTLDKSPPHWMRQALNADFSAADQAAFRQALNALEARISTAAKAGHEGPVSDLLRPGSHFNPLLDAFSAYYNGAEFSEISILDYEAYEDSGVNWRVVEGYGALIAALAPDADLRLRAPVTRIDRSGARLRLETPGGAVEAKVAIVTVPTPLLVDEVLSFAPDLPALREAAAALPLGLADKVYLGLDGTEAFEPDSHLFGDPARTETASYHLRPFGRPIVEVFLGGRHARGLENQGRGAASAFAIDELVGLLGSNIRARLHPLAETHWAHDPWARGSYSHAFPGGAGARAVLRQSHDERLIFAGEAASAHYFSTAHGAAETGMDAARRALVALKTG